MTKPKRGARRPANSPPRVEQLEQPPSPAVEPLPPIAADPSRDLDPLSDLEVLVLGVPMIPAVEYRRALETIAEQREKLDRIAAPTCDCAKTAGDKADVPDHLRCPSCFTGLGGRAARRKWQRQISGPLQKRCYVCDTCGTEWVVKVRSDVVDDVTTTTITLDEVRPPANMTGGPQA